ncbi:MAG: hypothetical protein IJ113_08690 [Eggerthellaceae bacterium]|nr:hypothetical protein [Eggerthellaceae bacterium]
MKHKKAVWCRRALALVCAFTLAFSTTFATPGAWADTQALSTSVPKNAAKLATYDARDYGYISPVRLQDPWGACWAFGALAAMEANLVKQGLAPEGVQLSARHLVYFAGTPVGSEAGAQAGEGQHPISELVDSFGDNAAFALGGHAFEVASTIATGEGVVFEATAPYQNDEEEVWGSSYSTDGTWALDEDMRYKAEFTLRNMHRLPKLAQFDDPDSVESFSGISKTALAAIKEAIVKYGAVSVSYCSFDGTRGYSDNYYDPTTHTFFTNDTMVIDHDVCIVGWMDDFPATEFTTGTLGSTMPEGDGAWIVKNSWGAETEDFPNYNSWGDLGYFYLSYYDRSATGFTAWEMMSVETSITNQYDYMGQRSNADTRIVDYEPRSYANVFQAGQDQILKAFSVNSYAAGSEYSVSIYDIGTTPLAGTDPRKGTLLYEAEGTIPWEGYHRIKITKDVRVNKGHYYSIVLSVLEPDGSGGMIPVASFEAGNNKDAVSTFGLSHYDTLVCNPGESFVLATIDGEQRWMDATEFAPLLHLVSRDQAYFGNACIKVFANPAPQPKPTPEPEPESGDEQESGSAASSDPATKQEPVKTVASNTSTSSSAHVAANTADMPLYVVWVLLLLCLVSAVGVAAARRNIRLVGDVRRLDYRA